jgi:nucleotide-binding universal stress UspA family protein
MRHGEPPGSILVPLDGSWRSESALVPAAPLAQRIGARLGLLTAQWSAAETVTAQHYLDARRAELRGRAAGGVAGPACDTEVVVDRDVPHAIVAAADVPGMLVCMATHGHGGVLRGVLGSVSEEVVRAGVAPVLLVGPALDPGWELPDAPEVFVALDGSATAREALPTAMSLAAAIGGTLDLVYVPAPPTEAVDIALPDPCVAMLEEVLASCAAAGVPAVAEVLDGRDPAAVIAEHAARRRASFVVAATHGRTGLARITMGSVVQRLVRQASCPVVVVRPRVLGADELVLPGSARRFGDRHQGGEEMHDARPSWRRDRDRSQSNRSTSAQG